MSLLLLPSDLLHWFTTTYLDIRSQFRLHRVCKRLRHLSSVENVFVPPWWYKDEEYALQCPEYLQELSKKKTLLCLHFEEGSIPYGHTIKTGEGNPLAEHTRCIIRKDDEGGHSFGTELAYLATFHKLEILKIYPKYTIRHRLREDAVIKLVEGLTCLRELTITNGSASNTNDIDYILALQIFPKLTPTIEVLDLSGITLRVNGGDLEGISRMPNLKYLKLTIIYNKQYGTYYEWQDYHVTHSSLKHLEIRVINKEYTYFSDYFPNLEQLIIDGQRIRY